MWGDWMWEDWWTAGRVGMSDQREGGHVDGWMEGLVGGKVSGLMPGRREEGWVREAVGLWW